MTYPAAPAVASPESRSADGKQREPAGSDLDALLAEERDWQADQQSPQDWK